MQNISLSKIFGKFVFIVLDTIILERNLVGFKNVEENTCTKKKNVFLTHIITNFILHWLSLLNFKISIVSNVFESHKKIALLDH